MAVYKFHLTGHLLKYDNYCLYIPCAKLNPFEFLVNGKLRLNNSLTAWELSQNPEMEKGTIEDNSGTNTGPLHHGVESPLGPTSEERPVTQSFLIS